ncbi:HAMP domain-containing sensor histidine kinase [Streptomyces sp. NPDC047971]|uniref:sensor histidine kinase n=1 Tax=Streptomyces sp. NPDC047971 TaxID=3154499 RepID=UPI0033FC0C04
MGEHRTTHAVWATGAAAWLVVAAAVAWLADADRRFGPMPPEGPERYGTDRVGPQVELLAWPGFLIGAVGVAAVCWLATRGRTRSARFRATLAAATTSGLLYGAYASWLVQENPVRPWLVAEEALRWGLMFIGPSAGVLTAAAVWAALGRGGGRISFAGRLVLTAAGTTAALSLTGVQLLRQAHVEGPSQNIDEVLWIGVTTGVPLVALCTGILVHLAAGRALRPVEAVRQELEDIAGHSLDRRVPVPPTDDVIGRLARTTNATLDRLERASVRQRQFVADAAHELRSPLAALRAQLESALRHPEGVAWATVVRDAAADVVRLQTLADDLLLLASMDGTRPGERASEVVDLAALAEDLVREHQHLPGAAGLRLTCRTDGTAHVTGEARQLERLLRNLLDNACRHADSAVTVTIGPDGDAAVLEVLDDGPGIPPADRHRVFDRFTRLDESRARTAGGAGLGLPIAREIATRHGGTLTAEPAERGARLVARLAGGDGWLPHASRTRAGGPG